MGASKPAKSSISFSGFAHYNFSGFAFYTRLRFAFAVLGRMWYTCRMGEFKSIVARAVCVVVIALAGRFYAGDVVGVMRH